MDVLVDGVLARPDRLIRIAYPRHEPCVASFSIDGGATWNPATVYLGATTDEWRGCDPLAWNQAVLSGVLPPGEQPCLWNYFFDLDLPVETALLRLQPAAPAASPLVGAVDLGPIRDVCIVDRRNVRALAGGELPGRWSLSPALATIAGVPSIYQRVERRRKIPVGGYYRYEIAAPDATALAIDPGLAGWHRLYVGMEPYSSFRVSLSGDDVPYEVPNWIADAGTEPDTRIDGLAVPDRLRQEFYVCSADLTGQRICLTAGGSRFWRDVSVRYLRLVPMRPDEVDHFHQVRQLARTRGRRFAGYVEPCTVAAYEPPIVTLAQSLRTDMRLHRVRGADELYVHVVRIGSKAWYHSRMLEWDDSEANHAAWMAQADPLASAVAEAHAVGLRVLADAGMNSTYYGDPLTERFANRHPEYLCPENRVLFDYRRRPVQDYVVAIVSELLHAGGVDGVNLDFARWGNRFAYDQASLVAVVARIQAARREAETEKGRALVLSARIPYDDPTAPGAADPVFIAALREWAGAGWLDRVMVCMHEIGARDLLSGTTPVRHYLDAIAGSRTELWGDLYWGTWHRNGGPARDLAIARGWAAQGLDGGFFYYMSTMPTEFQQIGWQLRLIDFPGLVVDPHHQ